MVVALWLLMLFLSSLQASPLVEKRRAVMFQACTETCDSNFFHCILSVHCPKKFPLSIPNHSHDILQIEPLKQRTPWKSPWKSPSLKVTTDNHDIAHLDSTMSGLRSDGGVFCSLRRPQCGMQQCLLNRALHLHREETLWPTHTRLTTERTFDIRPTDTP
ncbi:hypothetical protein LSAT2_027373 [Lamellibrachia satsuma]|nr:hypothetical protein LSAT2_027373 [Lamellibrachia satsuma]